MTEQRRGTAKTAESLVQLLRAGRVLRTRFGAVTVRFGEPISLAGLVSVERAGTPERSEMLQNLAYEICRRINGLITAGRSSVSAAALLGSPQRALRVSEFRTRVVELADLLELLGLQCSEPLRRNLADGTPEACVELLLQSGAVERRESSEGEILQFSESARDRLAYYRATIAPALVWPAALALSLRSGGRRDEVLSEASSWLDLLQREFFPPEPRLREPVFDKLLEHFARRGWVECGAGPELEVPEDGAPKLAFLRAQIRPVLETYRALLDAALEDGAPTSRGALIARAQTRLEEQLLLGEARYPEAVCPVTLGNAFALLLEWAVLSVDGNPRAADALVSQGSAWSRLAPLRERVARVLESA